MKIKNIQIVSEGKYLHTYKFEYENEKSRYKTYEMVSRNKISSAKDIGCKPSGVVLIVTVGEKLLLLKEFRMAVNRFVFNLCEGMLEEGEQPEECAIRELKEETGLDIISIKKELCPCYPAPAFSDTSHYLIFAKAKGDLIVPDDDGEIIVPGLYSRTEIEELLKKEQFSATAQMAAYFFSQMQDRKGYDFSNIPIVKST